jgi:hypothetical protein
MILAGLRIGVQGYPKILEKFTVLLQNISKLMKEF